MSEVPTEALIACGASLFRGGSFPRILTPAAGDAKLSAVDRSVQLRKIKKKERGSESPFEEALLICRSFLGFSSDKFKADMKARLGRGGIAVDRYRAEPEIYISALKNLRLLEAMTFEVNRQYAFALDTLRVDTRKESSKSGPSRSDSYSVLSSK